MEHMVTNLPSRNTADRPHFCDFVTLSFQNRGSGRMSRMIIVTIEGIAWAKYNLILSYNSAWHIANTDGI